ncbi:MAG: RloB domain-containing protein [Erysipelotrichaceae bacterium]|nr:RloB domain-containing protein [Erysipelotrichaceae bacterium]
MPHRTRSVKPYVIVFCEGESEQAYTDFLKKEFHDVVSIKRVKTTGLFEEADSRFKKDRTYRDYTEVTDEIWFFFDVEEKDKTFWDARLKIIRRLRSLRKNPGIKVRLLMTTGCMEYWLMLHYEMYIPSIQTIADKQHVIQRLKTIEPNYRKGNEEVTAKIAQHYPTAVTNARETVIRLLQEGLPGMEDTDERNGWLCRKCLTFSTVYEAIDFLVSLKPKM